MFPLKGMARGDGLKKKIMEGLIMARKNSKDKGIIEKAPGVWWIDCYVNGKRFRKMVGNKTAARAFYEKVKTEEREGRLFPEKYERKRVLFSELAKDRIQYANAHHKRQGDDNARVRLWVEAFGDKDAATITPSMIEQVIYQLNDRYAPATINRAVVVLKAVYNKAVRDGLLMVNPASKVKLLKVNNELVRYLTSDQEVRLLECLEERFKPIVIVGINTGLRQGELLRLTWQDIDWHTGIMTINETKSGERRRVPMNSIVQEILFERQNLTRSSQQDRIFQHDSRFLRRAFDRAVKEAGLSPFRFHDLRHTFASRLAMQGVNDRTLMTLGGWKSPRMLNRYAHLSPTHLWQAVEGLTKITPSRRDIQNRTDTKTDNDKIDREGRTA